MEYTAYSAVKGEVMYPELPVATTAASYAEAVEKFAAWRGRWAAQAAAADRDPELVSAEPLRIVNDTIRIEHEITRTHATIPA